MDTLTSAKSARPCGPHGPHGDSSLHAALTSIGVSPSVASLLHGGSGIVNLTAAQASGTNGDNHDDDDHDGDNSSSGKRNNLHTERNRHSILGRIIRKQKFHRTYYPSPSSSPSLQTLLPLIL